ncbi:MAG: PEP-CTERM sorting domain-containing protein [Akkermansiaceae bacterium]
MRIQKVIFTIILCLTGCSQGVLIRMSFSGNVDEVLTGDLFPEDSSFRVEIDYEVPEIAADQSPTEVGYGMIISESRLVIDDTIFRIADLGVVGNLEFNPGGNDWLFLFLASDPLGAGAVPPFLFHQLSLNFRLPEGSVDDPGRLPSSLEQWDFNDGTMEMTFVYEDESQSPDVLAWAFRSTTFSSITLGQIPEPSGMMLLCVGGLLGVLRRKRINS